MWPELGSRGQGTHMSRVPHGLKATVLAGAGPGQAVAEAAPFVGGGKP